MSDNLARLAEAEAAKSALDRWLAPAFEVLTSDYTRKMVEIASKPLPKEGVAQIEKLSVAIKVIEVVRLQIESVVRDGQLAEHDQRYADQVANVPTYARKRWGF